tara:strand:- start:134 stop:436 length:303 start_codon:yes stop_codon:yes gene_type:complete
MTVGTTITDCGSLLNNMQKSRAGTTIHPDGDGFACFTGSLMQLISDVGFIFYQDSHEIRSQTNHEVEALNSTASWHLGCLCMRRRQVNTNALLFNRQDDY